MYPNTLTIVEEYLRSTDTQLRKNALSALAVMSADLKAMTRLIDIALVDHEESVQQHAEEEIVALKDEDLNSAVMRLQRALDDEQKQQRAYAILGRLKGQGIAVSMPRKSWLTRIRLALRIRSYVYPERNLGFRLKAWKPSLLGGFIGLCILAVFLASIAHPKLSEVPIYIASLASLLGLSPLTGIVASQRTTPIGSYLDETVAYFVEVGSAIVSGVLGTIAFLLLFLFLFKSLDIGSRDLGSMLIFVTTSGLLIGAIRAGTILAHRIFPNKRLSHIFQVGVGASLLFLMFTGYTLLVWLARLPDSNLIPYLSDSPIYRTSGIRGFAAWIVGPYNDFDFLWVFLLSLGIAVANAFATIDGERAEVWTVAPRARKIICFAIVLPVLVLALLILASPRRP
jgi:hypothetical protein